MPAVTKDLYLANSLKELKEKSSASLPSSQNITIIYNSLKKMIQEAHNMRMDGDEEKAFFLYFRLALIIEKLKKSAEYIKNKPTYDRAVNEIWGDAISWTEKLQKSLEKRYKDIKVESPEPQRKKSEEQEKKSQDVETTSKIEMPVSITSSQLYNLIMDPNTSLLIIDARLPGEFEFSQIRHLSIFNIPETLLVPGVTAHSLEKWMNESVCKLWHQRGNVDFVILVDWNSYEKSLNSTHPLYCLREALCKWDSKKILKTDPLVLEGGYIDFVNRYPMMTTNSNVNLPPRVSSSHSMMNDFNNTQIVTNFNAVDVSYPTLDDELEMDKEERLLESQKRVLIDRTNKPSIPATPSSSLTRAPITPAVNRALKPTYDGVNAKDVMPYLRQDMNNNLLLAKEQLEKEREFEELRRRREREAEEGMRFELQKQEETLQKRTAELEAEAKAKEEEHLKALSTISQMKKDLEKSNQRIHELEELQRIQILAGEKNRIQQEVARMREERKKKERESSSSSLLKKKPEPSEVVRVVPPEEDHAPAVKPHTMYSKRGSLSRSHSSPNIAQMIAGEEEEASQGVAMPHFDRTLKPPRTSDTAIRKLNLETNRTLSTMRNLQPIYGIGGRAVTGLKNLGNTCYMNSIIQCLSATTPLTSYLCNREYLRHINKNNKFGTHGEVLAEFTELIIALWAGQYKSVVPRDFKNIVSKYVSICAGHDQQDSHEFLMVLLEKMHAEVNTSKAIVNGAKLPDLEKFSDAVAAEKFWNHHKQQNESIFVDLFEGLLRSTLTCLYCHKVSNSYEVFTCLSLPLPAVKANKTSLKECLNFFLKTEKMSGEGAWNCPQCKMKQDAEKKLVILRLPKILIFHLKRFSYEGLLRQKLQTLVDFPLQDLDMNTYVYGSKVQNSYYLYAVVNHFGTLEGGHYIAHCKNSNTNKWFKFDDQEVTELSLTEVRNPLAAYLLFYSSIDLAKYV